jgi:hypothetical protein
MTQKGYEMPEIILSGPELSVEVARRVMGWDNAGLVNDRCYISCGQGFWAPHESISDAWEVVEKLFTVIPQQDIHIEHLAANQSGDDGQWSVSTCFENEAWVGFVYAETAPHAICLAALKAVDD